MEDVQLLSIISALQSYRYSFADEKEFQDGIERALQAAFIPYERECLLGEFGIVDFLCDGVGIEAKIKGNKNDILRQVARYTKSDRVKTIIVATTKYAQLSIGGTLNGKTVRSVFLGNPF